MRFNRNVLAFIIFSTLAVFGGYLAAEAGEKELKIEWQQDQGDLSLLTGWELFSSQDPDLPFDQWFKQGDIPYDGNPASVYDATFTITAPDGAETPFWFKMTAVDTEGKATGPSAVQEEAPFIVDFKPPAAVTDLAGVYDNQAKTITLTWSTDPADTDIVAQKLYKSSTAGGPYTDIAPGMVQQSPYVYPVQPADSGKWLYFVVVLTDNDNNFSANSNEAAVKMAMGVPFGLRVNVTSE